LLALAEPLVQATAKQY